MDICTEGILNKQKQKCPKTYFPSLLTFSLQIEFTVVFPLGSHYVKVTPHYSL